MRHTKSHHEKGKSYIYGDIEVAQKLIDEYGGKGKPICSNKNKQWNNRERIILDRDIGVHVDVNGEETVSNVAMIIYSKTGTHIYPVRKENKS